MPCGPELSDRPSESRAAKRPPPPNDPSAWGVVLYALDENDVASIRAIDVKEADPAIISLIATGDNTHRKQSMTLARAYRLRVIAVGEGLDGKMYDYGWIEDAATGERVWTMAYERTLPAGGSGKNRLADELVELPAGRYRAVYESDGSHSAGGGWNAEPPAEPERWGLTILVPETGLAPR